MNRRLLNSSGRGVEATHPARSASTATAGSSTSVPCPIADELTPGLATPSQNAGLLRFSPAPERRIRGPGAADRPFQRISGEA